MKYFLISDNIDTIAGLRMVGIEGVVVHSEDDLRTELNKVFANREIGLVLVTTKLFTDYGNLLFDYKLNRREPLIVEMPDRHTTGDVSGSISRYIQEVVGIKI